MTSLSRYLRTAALFAVVLAFEAGSLGAQSATRPRQRRHRVYAVQTGPDQATLLWEQVPGATEYRIYLGPPAPGARPLTSSSASGRRAIVTGLQRLSGGAYLVAMAGRQVLSQQQFNPVTRAPLARPVAPTAVQAQETGPTEVTVTWNPVPGATAYMIGRAAGGYGLRMMCDICPPEPEFVDTTAVPGVDHRYTVQAIFPLGISARVLSNTLTVGAAQLAALPPAGQPVTPTPGFPPGAGGTTTPTYTPPGTPAGATTTPTTSTGSTPTGTPTGTPTTSIPTGTPQATTDTVPPRSNPQLPATVPDTTPPVIGPPPSGAESLVVPADTGSCVAARATPDTTAVDSLGRIDPRTIGIDLRTTGSNPDANTANSWLGVTTTNLGSADYRQGKCLNPGATGYPDLWDPIATASGLTSAERVAAWKEIGIVALEYKHILGRAPTPEETRRDVAALQSGTAWHQLWRQLAHSTERDQRFGYWAPAPIADSLQAQAAFGLQVPPWTAQQCYGGLGPKCGGLPEAINAINDKVYAYWFGAFKLPDNTEFAYIEMGVAVGSIFHDNACLAHKDGLNCNGLGAGDLVKNLPVSTTGTVLYAAASLEWNKAAWNLLDSRTWRARFGPYPTNLAYRDRLWYDDLRPMPARPGMMAPAVSMFTWPGLTVTYTGGETRQSRALVAPGGRSLDATDVAFCQSSAFASTGSFIGKAPWGVCADAGPTTGTHMATPVGTGTPIPANPTTSTPTTATPASCRLDYQRADNMWAAFGRPDGFLGVESISLPVGANKVFITDWKYEKQKNDGTTYYGSHLRVATNPSSRPVRLQLITNVGTTTTWVTLDPNTSKSFQADLREVYCQ